MDEAHDRSSSEVLPRTKSWLAAVVQKSILSPARHLFALLDRFASWLGALWTRFWHQLRTWAPWRRVAFAALILFFVYVGVYCVTFSWEERQTPPSDAIDEYAYLDQGWGSTAADSPDRMTYYYTGQGAFLYNVRYDWLVALERPWKRDPFISEKYMRAYGFIVDPTNVAANPDHLPIGLTKIWDPKTETMMVDMTCATCHSGELQVMKNGRRVAVRIDGGAAMHNLTSSKAGQFGTDLFASMIATWTNPFKWARFSHKVLGDNASLSTRFKLWKDFGGEIAYLGGVSYTDSVRHLYPVDDGYGRTDALGRIANNVYGTHLDPKNFHPGNAPVSYPALWNTWKFDWVQYTASVAQPMARNIGETLGVGAEYSLVNAYGDPVDANHRFATSTQVANLVRIEETLRKLQPPTWPEALFGKIDQDKAAAGKKLFATYCLSCHGPHVASCEEKQVDAPLKATNRDHWKIWTLPLQDIGTDPTTALNFVRNTYDLSKTGIKAEELRAALRPFYEEKFNRTMQYGTPAMKDKLNAASAEDYANQQLGQIDMSAVSNGAGLNYLITYFREQAYRDMNITDAAQREDLDGYGQLDTPAVLAAYRIRPLGGIWATGPFLHNGSVPNIYELLLPANQRSKTFYLKGRTFDPVKLGLVTDPNEPGAFLFDTSIPGNSNTGHEFRAGYTGSPSGHEPYSYGVIGPELTDEQRWAIIEYLKVAKDDDFMAPDSPNKCGPPASVAGTPPGYVPAVRVSPAHAPTTDKAVMEGTK